MGHSRLGRGIREGRPLGFVKRTLSHLPGSRRSIGRVKGSCFVWKTWAFLLTWLLHPCVCEQPAAPDRL